MYRDDRPPLSDWILDAYRTLASRINAREGGLSTDRAMEILITEETDQADAEYALQRLLDRGYLYQAEGELFVTQPDEFEE
jgi:hypothetical protein